MDVLPEMLDKFHPMGARFVIVLLGDPNGGAATMQGCNAYRTESGLAGDDRVVFALDPTGNARQFYEGFSETSVSVLTDRKTKIVLHDQFSQPSNLFYHVSIELERFFEELATQE